MAGEGTAATGLAGTLLAGRYRVLRELGRGATGRVLLAQDTAAGEVLRALKLVAADEVQRLSWEFARLRQVAHPHLAAVHDLLSLSGHPDAAAALVMDFAPGRRADRVVSDARGGAQARLRRVLRIGTEAARALGAVHAQGLVHGDVKPANVLVDDDGRAMLIDLGLCQPAGFQSSVSGTPGYLAPELLRGELGPAADLFALGVTLCRLLAGARFEEPTGGPATPATVALLSTIADELPPALSVLLQELLSQAPAGRPQRALEVAARLSRIELPGGGQQPEDALALDEPSPTPQELSVRMLNLPAVGQRDALSALQACGTGKLIVVHGPGGVGRSRLIREHVGALQRRRLAQGGRAPSYLVSDVLPVGGFTHDLLLHLQPGASTTVAALRRLVRAAAVQGAELTVLWERASMPERPGDGAAEGEAPVDAVALSPLSETDVAALLAEATGERAPSAALLREAMAASGGLSGRLCRLLSLGAADGVRVWTGPRLRRCAGLLGAAALSVPDAARPLAELLAVAGGVLPFAAACEGLGAGAGTSTRTSAKTDAVLGEVQRQAGALRAAGLVALDDAGGMRLRPDQQAALLSVLDVSARRGLADRLRDAALPSAARAHLAAVAGDRAGAQHLLLSAMAEQRQAGAPELASALATTLQAVLGGALQSELTVAWADALRAEGRYREALALLSETPGADAELLCLELRRLLGERPTGAALEAALGPGPAALRAVAARVAFDAGERGRALSAAAAVLADSHAGAGASARAAEVSALCALYADAPRDGLQQAETALLGARSAGDAVAEARLSAVAAMCAGAIGQRTEAVAHFARAAALARAAGDAHAAATYLVNLAAEDMAAGDLGRALASLSQAAFDLTRMGRHGEVARALHNLAHLRVLCGDVEGGARAAKQAAAAAHRAGDPAAELLATALSAELGDADAARGWLSSVEPFPELPPAERALLRVRALELSLRAGEPSRAAAHDAALQAQAAAASAPDVAVEAAAARARLSLAQGDAAGARELAAQAHAQAVGLGGFELCLRSALLLAECETALGDRAAAAALWAEVRARLDAAARGLSLPERLRLRRVQAYRPAWEAAPPVAPAAPASGDQAAAVDGESAGHARVLLGWAKRFMGERRPARLYELLVDCALSLSGAERGCVLRLGPGGLPRLRAARGLAGDELLGQGGDGPGLSSSVVGRVLSTGQPMSTVDALHDARLSDAASVHALSLRSVAAVPLTQDGAVVGAIYVEDRLRPFAFREPEMAALGDLAQLSSTALSGLDVLRAERRAARRLSATRAKLAEQLQVQSAELRVLKRHGGGAERDIVGSGPAMQRLLSLIERVAAADVPVLITGESGTGKELAARALHSGSARAAAPFVSENCAAIPETLLESALFGHERGAFTGAERRRTGLFEAADGGTLFLDEIGEMPLSMQTRLLRVLEGGEVRPVGGERVRKVDVRVVAATHRDLEAMVRAGEFRQDLYYRLAVVGLELPPLRARTEDIPELLSALSRKHAPDRRVRVSVDAMRVLQSLPWPGNVRQLENELRRALALSEGDGEIRPEHLSPRLLAQADAQSGGGGDLNAQVDQLKRRLIREALQTHGGNQTRAARALGVSRFGLQKMLQRLQLG